MSGSGGKIMINPISSGQSQYQQQSQQTLRPKTTQESGDPQDTVKLSPEARKAATASIHSDKP
jgi:hypothetical protein